MASALGRRRSRDSCAEPPARDLGSTAISTSSECRDGGRPSPTSVRTEWTRPAMGHRYHRAPHPRGEGLLCRGARCVQPPRRRLVDRRAAHSGSGDECTRDGDRAATTTGRHDGDPQRSRDPIHIVGLHPAGSRFRSTAIDGIRRRLLRQRNDRVVLESHAGRASRPSAVEDPRRTRECDLRIPRDPP